ncbi:MAG: sigma-70 family RNA polymerase sigma factor [bacterium]
MLIYEPCHEIERLAENEKEFLWSQALYITNRTEDAEDLLQETLMKACKGFEGFKHDSNFRAWTRKIMVNTHINRVRRQASNALSIEDYPLDRYNVFVNDPSHVSYIDDPEKVFFHNHIREEILNLFYSLPEKYKFVFTLFHFEGYSYEEISKSLKMPVGTVKSRIYRARQYLSEKIRDMSIVENPTN